MVCSIRRKIYQLEGSNHPSAQNLYKLLPELLELKSKNFNQLKKIREKLNALSLKYRGTKHHSTVCSVISVLKLVAQPPQGVEWDSNYKHAISDHALCMYLERYRGLDTLALKDHILAQIDTEIHDYIFKDGTIITVLPKGANDE